MIKSPPALDLEQNYINTDIEGSINIRDENKYEVVFACSIRISGKVEIVVFNGIDVSGKINDINIEVGEISINKENTEFLLEEAKGFITILLSILP